MSQPLHTITLHVERFLGPTGDKMHYEREVNRDGVGFN